ncbi:undecaprenyl diphosphate synthase family protein [Mycobacterium sp. MS1601]|uniref:undecaprenyl diphosphate synthase family protein n=1 Tax=Mycobacterium sp. MS1601 TaxID=1936029 RepID=UPI001F1B7D6C|nr:undecaprenyl diphosphate synthase family protein [Mycobacterium sp. MS1601]
MHAGPAHVGLIPDGLRRWAHSNNTGLAESYLRGAHKVTEILLALQRHGVRTVTVYNLSRANLDRTDEELDAVYEASTHFFTTLIPRHFDPAICTLRLHGNRELLPGKYVSAAHKLETTMSGQDFRINILAAYDAADELRRAHRRAVQDNCDIADAFDIDAVDLVIRTTPEPLLSGFPPLQSQYAQLVFLPTPLNDLEPSCIDHLLTEFQRSPQLRGR